MARLRDCEKKSRASTPPQTGFRRLEGGRISRRGGGTVHFQEPQVAHAKGKKSKRFLHFQEVDLCWDVPDLPSPCVPAGRHRVPALAGDGAKAEPVAGACARAHCARAHGARARPRLQALRSLARRGHYHLHTVANSCGGERRQRTRRAVPACRCDSTSCCVDQLLCEVWLSHEKKKAKPIGAKHHWATSMEMGALQCRCRVIVVRGGTCNRP